MSDGKSKIVIVGHPLESKPQVTREESNADMARSYMSTGNLYPSESVWRLFSTMGSGAHSVATNREFAFFVFGKDGTEGCYRHMCFPTPTDFDHALRSLRPHRVDVGGIYVRTPSREHPSEIIAAELVFDIDIDAYDGREGGILRARSCCSGASYCRSCWPLVNVAADIIVRRLESYGARKIAIFYSGGRGFHIRTLSADWPFFSADRSIREAARKSIVPTESARDIVARSVVDRRIFESISAIVDIPGESAIPIGGGFLGWFVDRHPEVFVTALSGSVCRILSENASTPEVALEKEMRDSVSGLNARIVAASRVVDVIAKQMASMQIGGMDEMSKYPSWERSISVVRDLIEFSKNAISMHPDPHEPGIGWTRSATAAIFEAAVACMWPRIDSGLTDQPGHLLRAPMGVHASTGRLGVRVPRESLMTFYPDDASPKITRRDGKIEFVPKELAEAAFKDFERWINE